MNNNKQPILLTSIIFSVGIGFSVLSSLAWAGVSGTVYQDLPVNGNSLNTYGVKDTNELGVAGVTVTAYPGGATTMTLSDGTWALNTTGDVRIEFSGFPSYLRESPDGNNQNSSVQFVANNGTVDFGLHNPADFSGSADPLISIPSVEPNLVTGNTNPVLESVLYSSTGLNANFTSNSGNPPAGPIPNADADANEIGAVWGTAWQSNQQRLFAGTFLKRHAGMANGPGYVYVLDYSTTPATVSHQFDLAGVVPANGGAAIDLGSVCRRNATDGDADANCDPLATGLASDYELPAATLDPSVDLDAFGKVGTMGLGDLDMQENSDMLWLVNPHQKALINIAVSADSAALPGVVNQYPLATMTNWPACAAGELRPWGLTFHAGRGYLGVVCDASVSQNNADMRAYVLSFDPNDIAAGLNAELDFSLDYFRGTSANARFDFNYWVSSYPPVDMAVNGNYREYPQPLLSDIEFDKQGNMYLNFMDRWGNQVGSYNYEALSGNTNTSNRASVNGEVLKVCDVSGAWELEGDANCPAAWAPAATGGVAGNGEHFDDIAGDNTPDSAEGSMAILKGSGQIVSSTLDPHPSGVLGADYWNTQGITTWDLTTGEIDNWYSVEYGSDLPVWGKAHAIGDIEILTDPAPIEIGNRVWDDSTANDVQDAGELGLAGVTVELLDGGGVIASAVTDANGYYIFSNDPNGTSTASHRYNLISLVPNANYTVRIPNASGASQQAALGTRQLVTANSGEGGLPDINDSDAVAAGVNADISVVAADIPDSGANNHSYDVGFRNAPACSINQPTITTLCNDNGTASDASDDTFSYTINVTGSGVGGSYSISGGDTQANLPYGVDQSGLGNFLISNGDLALDITDDTTASCTLTAVTVTAPASCSSVLPEVDLAVIKSVSQTTVISGDTVSYTITVTNNGPADASGVELADQLPSGVTYVSHSASQGTYTQGTGIWDVGNLQNAGNATLTINVTID